MAQSGMLFAFYFTNTKVYEKDEGVSKSIKGRPFKIPWSLILVLPLLPGENGRLREK